MPPSPTDEERTHAHACYAVAMHLHANRKVGRAGLVILGLAIAAAVYFHSLWFLAGGLAIWVATYFIVIQSCVRFVNRSIGMPSSTQAFFSELYKTDPNFARDVDNLASGDGRSLREFGSPNDS